MKNVVVGSWVLFLDECSKEKVMVKVVEVDNLNRIATVLMNLAVRKGEPPKKYRMRVSFDEIKQPVLKIKPKKKRNLG